MQNSNLNIWRYVKLSQAIFELTNERETQLTGNLLKKKLSSF
jgi:hypothetical protein